MEPVQKKLIFRYFRKLNHGQRTTFIKGPSQNSKKSTIFHCILSYLTAQCTHCALQSIQSMKLYNQYVGTARYKILPIIRHCVPFCAHYFFFLRNMLFSHSFMHFCCDLLSLRFTHILAEKLLLAIVLLLL